MKKIYLTITGILAALFFAFGQGSPANLPADISNTSQTVSATSSQNYILNYTYLKEFTNHPVSLKTGDASPEIQYFDGLGRPVQTVSVKASQLGADMLTYQTYDVYGNQDKSYLPYAKSSNNGAMVGRTTFISQQSTFLTGIYGSTDGTKGYSQPQYETSPLNRLLKQGAPGDDWQLDENPVEYAYKTNLSAESITTWKYTGDSYSSYTFGTGKLYVIETTDEDEKIVKEYKDYEGKVIQRETDGAKTRYCYDEFGLLRCVLQPMATSPATANYCFYYKYDDRKRLTDKKVPGNGWEYFIYDSRDRLVLSQDGEQRSASPGQWTYTIYEALNRPSEQGTWVTTSSRSTLVSSIGSNLSYMQGQGTRVPLKYLYYDTYSGAYTIGSDASVLGVTQASSNVGRLTWEETKLLDSETGMDISIKTTYFYDKYGRLIQTATDNHLNGMDYITNKYNFANQVIQTRYRHTADGVTTYTDQYSDYNHRGVLMKTRYKINGGTELLLFANSYDETGQLIDKYLHSISGSNFLQRNDYQYNIRGWLTKIDNPLSFSENDMFGLELYYNTPPTGGTACYNGNISGMRWGNFSHSDFLYKFTYDNKNRLDYADFYKSGYATYALDTDYSYDNNGNLATIKRYNGFGACIDDLTYNYIGNQVGDIKDNSGDVPGFTNYPGNLSTVDDDFDYDYNGNITYEPNKIIHVSYNLLNLPKEMGFTSNRKINYFYTFNGEKLRKTVEDNGTITKVDYCGPFVYETASGVRSLKYIITPEGRAIKDGANWVYEYNLKDHLGNTRVTIRDGGGGTAAPYQFASYYPYGMEMTMYSWNLDDNKYLYNGKEHQNDFELDWYDYGSRYYDPELARFHTVDPLSENEHNISLSPYHYVANNPILFIDPNGEDWYDINGTITWKDQEGELKIDDQTYQSLGKNVLVGTHNRDKDGNEEINTATFSLYLESNTEGASATINGNTVPADIEQFGTLAEGLYDAEYTTYKGDGAILIEGGGDVPTVSGNPNNPDNYNADGSLKPTSEHVMDEVFFHKGNWARESLSTNMFRNGKRVQISEGCQTGGCGPGSLPKYRAFIKNAVGFKGKYYLRANPNKK